MLEKLYKYLTIIYFTFVRDPIIAFSRCFRNRDKELILDMDWYRWTLTPEEVRMNLYKHPEITKAADFIHVSKSHVFKGEIPLLDVTPENYKDLSYDGLNLWGICKASIICKLQTFKIDPSDPTHWKEITSIYGEAARGVDSLKKLFNKLKPDTVFIFQGGFFDSRCVVEVARRFGIKVVGVESSMMGKLLVFDDLSGQIINRHSLARMGSDIMEAVNVTDLERKEVFKLWQSKLAEKTDDHRTGGIDSEEEIRSDFGIPENHKIVLLLAQVMTDTSIVLDSTIYEDPIDMIEDAARHVKDMQNTTLLIRLHPKEFKGISPVNIPYDRLTYKNLKARGIDKLNNVKIIEDTKYNTYTMMKMADAGITINSQAGLEMCLLGKPVMVCGRAFYGGKGFTVDLGHRAAFGPTLDFLIEEVMTPEDHKLALNFLYHFYKRHLFDHKLSIHQKRLAQIFQRSPIFDIKGGEI